MAVVDVLLSHMDRNTVQHMKPSTNLDETEGCRQEVFVCILLGMNKSCLMNSPSVCICAAHMPGLAPAIITIRRAMRLCRFHFSMEAARQMTPISSRVVSLQYSAAT